MIGSKCVTVSELRDLDKDLPTTPEDVAALRRARRDSAMSPQQIDDAVRQFGDSTFAERRARKGLRGEPFTLRKGD